MQYIVEIVCFFFFVFFPLENNKVKLKEFKINLVFVKIPFKKKYYFFPCYV